MGRLKCESVYTYDSHDWVLTQDGGVKITVTDSKTGGTASQVAYPFPVLDAKGYPIIYKVPLYSVTVTVDGVTSTFSAIRFGVQNYTSGGSSPNFMGITSGTYDVSYADYLGGSFHIDGALRGGAFFHNGPPNENYIYPTEGCIAIFGEGEWGRFQKTISDAAPRGSGIPIQAVFINASPPALIDSGRR